MQNGQFINFDQSNIIFTFEITEIFFVTSWINRSSLFFFNFDIFKTYRVHSHTIHYWLKFFFLFFLRRGNISFNFKFQLVLNHNLDINLKILDNPSGGDRPGGPEERTLWTILV